MSLLLLFAAMTVAAMLAALWPLLRKAATPRAGSDVAVYRDQLDEVERDLTAGYIGPTEAEAARVEVSRRLLAAAAADRVTAAPVSTAAMTWRRRSAAVAVVLALPGIAIGLYLWLGSPQLASAQLAAHGPVVTDSSAEDLIAQAEAYLQRNPNDGRAWEVLAPVYMQLGRYSDSVTAWNNTLQLLGESADRHANLGEALTMESNGVVTAEAKAAFARAVQLDDTTVTARFYLGLAAEQDGKREQAAEIWRRLIAEAPAGAPWVDTVRGALARVENGAAVPTVGNATATPSPADHPDRKRRWFKPWSRALRHDFTRTAPTSTAGFVWCAPIRSSARSTRRALPLPMRDRHLPGTSRNRQSLKLHSKPRTLATPRRPAPCRHPPVLPQLRTGRGCIKAPP